MSKKPKVLRKGLLHLGRGEYSQVIGLLESKIPLFLENKEFYTILAKAFFYTGDYSGAKLYFERGQKIVWDTESSLFLAVLGLKRRDFNSSLRIWLDILDEDPKNIMAKRGLALLKKYSSMDDLENFIHSKKINKLIPRKKIILAKSTISILSIIILIGITSIITVKMNFIDSIKLKLFSDAVSVVEDRSGLGEFEIKSLKNDFIDYSNESVYSFTGAQIEDYFKMASKLFNEGKDNKVRTYLNLIKYSNSNNPTKQKAEHLEQYLIDPMWTNYSDDFTYSDVINNLYKYEKCIIKWKGKLSNLDISDKKIKFSLLVGYDKGKILEGVVPVELNENIKIQDNLPIEVLGRVIIKDDSFYLEALTVMQYIIKDK